MNSRRPHRLLRPWLGLCALFSLLVLACGPSNQPTAPAPTASATTTAEAPLPDWAPGDNMLEALVGIVRQAGRATRSSYGFDDGRGCLLGAFLMPHEKVTVTRTFRAGVEYALIGSGTKNAVDVDLAISNSRNQILAQDTDQDITPVVVFRPKVTAEYNLTLVLQAGAQDKSGAETGSFVAAAIMRTGGSAIGGDQLQASLGGILKTAQRAAAIAKKKGLDLYFHVGKPNGWALYTTILPEQDSIQYTNIRSDTDKVIVVGGADALADDIDIGIVRNEQLVAKDTDADPTPLVVFDSAPGQLFDVLVRNAKSRGPTLVSTLILELEKSQ